VVRDTGAQAHHHRAKVGGKVGCTNLTDSDKERLALDADTDDDDDEEKKLSKRPNMRSVLAWASLVSVVDVKR
jgi:hypothetical protein